MNIKEKPLKIIETHEIDHNKNEIISKFSVNCFLHLNFVPDDETHMKTNRVTFKLKL